MAARTVAVLKFVGSISLGLLTGVSYTLTTIALPSLLTLPSATSASHAFTHLTTRTLTDLRIWAGLSTTSFLLAFALSPRGARHPYLLWSALCVGVSGITDLFLRPESTKTILRAREVEGRRLERAKTRDERKSAARTMESSYDVLGADSASDKGVSDSDSTGSDIEENVNGEEIRRAMEGFRWSQSVRTGIAAVGFAMSVVGIWGDGF